MYIFGASGHGKAVIELVESRGEVHGVFDDNVDCKELLGYAVSGFPAQAEWEEPFVIAIGDNRIRKDTCERINAFVKFGKLVHSSAIVSLRSTIGEGTIVMELAIVKVDARLGRHVLINTSASVDHDCTVGDFVHLAPNATLCGGVTIGEGTFVGAGATVIPGVRIGAWCKIAAGSVVTKDIADGATWIGAALKKDRVENPVLKQ